MLKPIFQLKSSSWLNQVRSLNFSFRSLVAREPSLWLLYQPYIWWRELTLPQNVQLLAQANQIYSQYEAIAVD